MMTPTPIADVFRFCPRCGHEANAASCAATNNPFRCSGCEFTYYFGPVTAVGGIIANEADQVLLIRRARDPGKGRFGLPGGFVDAGESAETALAREVQEELGLTVQNCEVLVTFPNSYNYRGTVIPVLDVFYTCRIDETESIQIAPTEVMSWEWCACNQQVLAEMAFESNRLALETFAARNSS